MQNLAVNGYTRAEVIAALHNGRRHISFRYDLLDSNEQKIKALTTVESASISMSAFADIKRTAKFNILDDNSINFASDRIQPFIRLKMPDDSYTEWSQGIFLLSSPDRSEQNGNIYRDIEAYDGLQVLNDDKFEDRYAIGVGTNYITAIKEILTGAGIIKTNIEPSALTLPATKEFEPGTTKLSAINSLLAEINFVPIYVDEIGFYTSMGYAGPDFRAVDYTYSDNELSVIYNGLVDKLDLFSVPNKFIAYTSNPDSASLRSVYTNTSADSPLSTVSRGRTITDVRKVDDIADQTTLDAYVARIAFEASQIYGYITAETAIMPFHSVYDVIRIEYSSMGIYEKFTETDWSYDLSVGAKMKHSLRKVVNIL